MILLFGHDETVAGWVGKQIGKDFTPPYTALGVIDSEGTLRGGFVFNNYTGTSIELSAAGTGIAQRGVWVGMLDYVFGQLKCSRLQAHTRADNKAVRRQLPKLGFRFEGTARRMFGRVHGLSYSLTRDDLAAFRARWRLIA